MRIVLKVGSSTLSEKGVLAPSRIAALTELMAQLHPVHELLLVSSGAVAAGAGVVPGLNNEKTSDRQALAAVGQALLMRRYAKSFEPYGIHVAQILLTKDDFASFSHSQNAKSAIDTLLKHKVIPIINENDTVVIDELLRGDNDQLSARVAFHFDADLLVILSDIDGYYDANPHTYPDAQILPLVDRIPPEALKALPTPNDTFATGGIVTKLKAADFLMQRGGRMFLASGFDLTPVRRFLLEGVQEKGTLFCPR
jgi:glutamate 5-kinase